MSNSNIPPQWKSVKLGDVCKLKNGYAFKSNLYIDDGIPVIRISDINGGVVSSNKAVKVFANKEYENYLVENNDILVAMSGATTGKFGIFKSTEKAYQNQRVGKFQILNKEKIDNQFLLYQLHALKRQIEKDAYGGAQPNISSGKIESMEIVLPPIETQQLIVSKIEELFSELDKSVTELKTAKQQLKTYRQSVLKWAFEGKLTNSEARSENFELKLAAEPHEKYGEQNNLPEGWKWVKINKFLYHPKKGMATGPFGTALKKHEHQKYGVPVLGIENIGEGIFQMPNKIYVSIEKAKELQSFKVLTNDIIISRSGTVGEICCVPENMENALISTNLIRVRLNQKTISSKYFVYLFQGGIVREQVKELCKGSSRAFLNQTILNTLDFPFCPIEEQQHIIDEIESRFSISDKMEESINEGLQQAEALRQSILKMAFEGRLV